jgi:hypothetical protein
MTSLQGASTDGGALDPRGQFLACDFSHEKAFLVRRFAGEQLDLRFFQAEPLAQQFDYGFVCFALFGGLRDGDLQHAILHAADFVAAGAGMGTHREDCAVGVRFEEW